MSNPTDDASGIDFGRLGTLALAATGVVYGDIGTSPLYTVQECFGHGLEVTPDNVFGIASLLLWSIIVVVTLKYIMFVMRADNRGEGGILALLALVGDKAVSKGVLLTLGLFGSALFYGDGIITPAISVLSAVEGLEIAAPALESVVIPLSLMILTALFAVQAHGTQRIGVLFGPIMVIWFLTIAVLGVQAIAVKPEILMAANPLYGIEFLFDHGLESFLILGAVVLAVTGGEALYADMGHFGKLPIQTAWFVLVLPSLAVNYLGQSALLLDNPDSARNPFFLLLPSWGVIPMVLLATAATVIASQAVISGVFSLVRQAIQLGLTPRLAIKHTSGSEEGQIYIPRANWALLLGVVVLVLGFKSSSNLAAAYGIAVTGTMSITTVLALVVAKRIWRWHPGLIAALGAGFLTVDLTFFGANVLKIPNGGWFPLVVGCAIFIVMITWKDGRQILQSRLAEQSMPLEDFLALDLKNPAKRVSGTAVFLTGISNMVPLALLHNLKHNKVLHERVVLMTVLTERVPHVPARERLQIEDLGQGFHRMIVRYGFFQEPDIPVVLKLASTFGMDFEMMQTSFYMGRETFAASATHPSMLPWREKLFVMMSRNALAATEFFRIPPGRVVELGTQVQL